MNKTKCNKCGKYVDDLNIVEKAGNVLCFECFDVTPPCCECGAETSEQAEVLCICSGDKDDCHGCRIWHD